jgi:hypothetical protein
VVSIDRPLNPLHSTERTPALETAKNIFERLNNNSCISDRSHVATGVENSIPGRYKFGFFSIPVVHITYKTRSDQQKSAKQDVIMYRVWVENLSNTFLTKVRECCGLFFFCVLPPLYNTATYISSDQQAVYQRSKHQRAVDQRLSTSTKSKMWLKCRAADL